MGGEGDTFYKDILDRGRVSGEGKAENSRVDCSALHMFYLSRGLVQVTGGAGRRMTPRGKLVRLADGLSLEGGGEGCGFRLRRYDFIVKTFEVDHQHQAKCEILGARCKKRGISSIVIVNFDHFRNSLRAY